MHSGYKGVIAWRSLGKPKKVARVASAVVLSHDTLTARFRVVLLAKSERFNCNSACADVKRRGTIFSMGPPSSSAGSLREVLNAEVKLANMALAAEFVVLWHTETCPALRQHFANQYRKMIGVHPAARFQLAEGLARIAQTGHGAVGDLIDSLNRTTPHRPSGPATKADCS